MQDPNLSFDDSSDETSHSLSFEARKLKALMGHRSPSFSVLDDSLSSYDTPEMDKYLQKTMPMLREKSPRFGHKEETEFMTEKKQARIQIMHNKASFSQEVVVEQNFVGVNLLKNGESDCISRLNDTLSLRNFHR